jgi:predicted ATP-grasp superfamily ATP-dependent carboligase
VLSALVTDGHSRAALAGVRALGLAGVGVRSLSSTACAPAAWSRHASASDLGPPSTDERAFVARIAELARRHGPLVVFPGQEQAVGALARHAAGLDDHAVFPYSDPEVVLTLTDKSKLAPLAAEVGLAPPATLASGTAACVAADPPPTPCVVKTPAFSDVLPATRVCETSAELLALLATLPPSEPLIVQERAGGSLEALSVVLARDGEVAACFASRALRLAPTPAGASSLSVSIAPDRELVDRAVALLRRAGWSGLAHMQFLRTDRGPSLIDMNARFYGSLPLATAAGVNLPAIWHRVASGGRAVAPPRYRVGVRYRWLEGEIVEALRGDVGRLATRPVRGTVGAMWASDDPVSSALVAAQAATPYLRILIRRAVRRGRDRPSA